MAKNSAPGLNESALRDPLTRLAEQKSVLVATDAFVDAYKAAAATGLCIWEIYPNYLAPADWYE